MRRTSAGKLSRLLGVLFIILLSSFVVSCGEAPPRNPLLPPGFREAQIPDASIKGFVYLRPEEPLTVLVSRLLEEEPVAGLPSEVGFVQWTVWVGPWFKDFGTAVEFSDPAALDAVVRQLEKEPREVEHMRRGNSLYLFHGSAEWVQALKASIQEGRFVNAQEAYPDEWKLVERLPEAPPGKVLGAGFARVDEEFLQGIDEEFAQGGDVRRLVEAGRIKNGAFALYSQQSLKALAEFDEEFLKEMGLSALVVTKAGYPGFIVNFMFSRAVAGADLEKVQIEGGEAHHQALQEELHLFLKNQGNIFFVTLAAERDTAQKLLESALKQ